MMFLKLNMEKTIKTIILTLIIMLFFTACEEPGKTKYKQTYITIQKDDMVVVDYDGLTQELNDKFINYESYYHDHNDTFVIFRSSIDTFINIKLKLHLNCGAEGYLSHYSRWGSADENSNLEYGMLAEFTKKDLDENNCLQADGQLEDLTGSLYGYAEYSESRVTPVKHTVTSNTITYTAQEINEAFALFNE